MSAPGGTGTGIVSVGATYGDNQFQFQCVGASGTANYFGILHMVIPFYAETTAYKTAESSHRYVPDTSPSDGRLREDVVTWRNTAAITRVAVMPFVGTVNFVAGSHLLVRAS